MKTISIIIPAYKEEQNIPLIYEALRKILSSISEKYENEIIFVNDWSIDKTWDEILKICKKK